MTIAELLIHVDLVLVKHVAQLVVVCNGLFKLGLHHIKMLLEFFQRRKHTGRVNLKLRNLHDLLLNSRVRDGANEGEIFLDATEVLLGRDARQQRQFSFDVARLRSNEYGELL